MPSHLPDSIRHAIEASAAGVPVALLTKAWAELSAGYRAAPDERPKRHVVTREQRLAYAIARAPATYGAARSALAAVREVAPGFAPETLTDLGSGPGTATWAAVEIFPSLVSISSVERDGEFIEMGRELATAGGIASNRSVKWISGDLVSIAIPAADLVVAGYTLSEMPSEQVADVLERAWAATRMTLIVVEPGTPEGHAAILRYRDQLISAGAHVAAPCPHARACPMTLGDWCHFAARIDRSSLHRRLKGGEFGHEDEKYAYLAVSRLPVAPSPARILRHPRKPPKVVELELCAVDGLRRAHIGKGHREAWRAARDAQWGDAWRY